MNKKLTAIGGLAALAVVGGTWAFFTQDTTIKNKLSTSENSYGSTTVEKFNPGSKWEPGSVVDKEITVTNTGDYPIIARVKMDENWFRNNISIFNESDVQNEYRWWSGDNQANVKGDRPFFDVAEDQGKEDKGNPDGDPTNDTTTVVEKTLVNESNKLVEGKQWYLASDGYWYYLDVLTNVEGEKSTEKLLDKIKLSEAVDMGKVGTTFYWIVADETTGVPGDEAEWTEHKADSEDAFSDWIAGQVESNDIKIPEGKALYTKVKSGIDTNARGYSDADYVLNITTDVLQATPEALSTWTDMPENVETFYSNLLTPKTQNAN